DEEVPNELLSYFRNLLKKKQLIYIILFLFIAGTSFIVGLHEHLKINAVEIYERNEKKVNQNDLIIAYLLKPYENLKSIADRFNTDVETLQRLNPNFNISDKGKHLKIPVRFLHIVQQVDELPLIVAKYDSDVIDIMKANDIGNTRLKVGSEIIIPLKSENK
ncbi:MAG: LysM peptidoglycan-binding domain-containing protein, partial [Bacteroidales bacterium]|nr:LysM peptidoglycan-binding domain-containing protein [Bacteroidales bacterium]